MASAAVASGYRFARFGPIGEVLKLEQFTPVVVNPNAQVIVQPKLAPMHRTEAAVVNGTAANASKAFPKVAGFEGIATVVDSAANATLKNGDWVYVAPSAGATVGAGLWCTRNVVAAEQLVPVSQAAVASNPLVACLSCFLTAHGVVEAASLAASDVVVQNGGSSLTSLAVTALCKQRGIKVVTAAAAGPRFAAAEKRHKAAGAELVVPYSAAGARSAAKAIGKGGARAFLNGVGGRPFNDFLKLAAADSSRCVTYGAQSSYGLMWSGSQVVFKNLTIKGFYLPRYLAQLDARARQDKVNAALDLAKALSGQYPVEIVKALDGVPAAWDRLFVEGGKSVIQLA
jgi:NADPH:quinone reductase-like Zn-dependent oxidoreductase